MPVKGKNTGIRSRTDMKNFFRFGQNRHIIITESSRFYGIKNSQKFNFNFFSENSEV
jgi:hypothetical protein